jgi:hypothetical protein
MGFMRKAPEHSLRGLLFLRAEGTSVQVRVRIRIMKVSNVSSATCIQA